MNCRAGSGLVQVWYFNTRLYVLAAYWRNKVNRRRNSRPSQNRLPFFALDREQFRKGARRETTMPIRFIRKAVDNDFSRACNLTFFL